MLSKGRVPSKFCETFAKVTNSNRSENKIKFKYTFTKISKIRKSPLYSGVDWWNTLKVQHHKAENKKKNQKSAKN